MERGRMRGSSRELQQRARALRREMTPAERQLWGGIRGWRLGKFRRQHALGQFVLDFYCPAAHLCVEVDGGVHDAPEQQERDGARCEALAVLRIRVLRFRNEEVLDDSPSVLRKIESVLLGENSPLLSPLPLVGEGGASQRAG